MLIFILSIWKCEQVFSKVARKSLFTRQTLHYVFDISYIFLGFESNYNMYFQFALRNHYFWSPKLSYRCTLFVVPSSMKILQFRLSIYSSSRFSYIILLQISRRRYFVSVGQAWLMCDGFHCIPWEIRVANRRVISDTFVCAFLRFWLRTDV